MCASWNSDYNFNLPISKLNEIQLSMEEAPKYGIRFSHQKFPEVSFDGVLFDEYFLVLLSCISFNPQLPKRQKTILLREAIFTICQSGKLTKSNLISLVSKLENSFLKKSFEKYKFITSLSLRHTDDLKRRSINDVIITFSSDNQEILNTEIGSNINFYIKEDYPNDYTTVNLFVEARDINEAKDKASFAFGLLRGIWNFIVNRKKWPYFPQTITKPINSFKPGPITVGKKTTEKVYSNSWYQEDYSGNYNPASIDKTLSKFKVVEQEIRSKINKSNFQEDLSEFFVRYANCLDEKDPKKSFIKLWSLLESITLTSDIAYKITVKRTAFTYQDYTYHRLILNQLREFRNDLIHKDLDSEYSYLHVYQLKRYVERMLSFLLNDGQAFNDLNEVCKLINLPHDIKDLESQIKLREKAIKFRSF